MRTFCPPVVVKSSTFLLLVYVTYHGQKQGPILGIGYLPYTMPIKGGRHDPLDVHP